MDPGPLAHIKDPWGRAYGPRSHGPLGPGTPPPPPPFVQRQHAQTISRPSGPKSAQCKQVQVPSAPAIPLGPNAVTPWDNRATAPHIQSPVDFHVEGAWTQDSGPGSDGSVGRTDGRFRQTEGPVRRMSPIHRTDRSDGRQIGWRDGSRGQSAVPCPMAPDHVHRLNLSIGIFFGGIPSVSALHASSACHGNLLPLSKDTCLKNMIVLS